MKKRILPFLILSFIIVASLTYTYAITSVSHNISGSYYVAQQAVLSVTPASTVLGLMKSDDVKSFTITLANPSSVAWNGTFSINEPAYIQTGIVGWQAGTFKVIPAGGSLALDINVRIGMPANNINQTFAYRIDFYG